MAGVGLGLNIPHSHFSPYIKEAPYLLSSILQCNELQGALHESSSVLMHLGSILIGAKNQINDCLKDLMRIW